MNIGGLSEVTVFEDTLDQAVIEWLIWLIAGSHGTIHVERSDGRKETYRPGDVDVSSAIPPTAYTLHKRFWEKAEIGTSDECWEWQRAKSNYGYGRFKIGDSTRYAHRVSYRMLIGPIPGERQINHKCHNPSCINPDHIYLGNQKQNNEDCRLAGRHKASKGTEMPHGFNADTVREIRARYENEDVSYADLARQYNVMKETIGQIIRRETYRHID